MPTAQIATKQALFTLVQLHAELAGKIDANKQDAQRLAAEMIHVEAVIKLMDPYFNVARIAVKRRNRNNKWFKRGTMFRAVLTAMKGMSGPLTVNDIATRILKANGVAEPDRETIVEIEGGVRAVLRAKNGRVVRKLSNEVPAHWELLAK